MTRRCRSCGHEIAAARLAALPMTPWCVRCAERRVARVGGAIVMTDNVPELVLHPTQERARQTLRSAFAGGEPEASA